MSTAGSVIRGYVVPGKPQPLLVPEQNEGWSSIRRSFEKVRDEIAQTDADLLLIYSTQWLSIIGHQIQADPEPTWNLVDQDFHALGTMDYSFRIDAEFADRYCAAAKARGLTARTVAYRGFPIDTGSVVALQLLNPDNRIPACIVSCNMYADRSETLILGKAAADAIQETGKKVVAVSVTQLSNRMWTRWIDPAEDAISSLKDDEWNRKLLELFAAGRLEDVGQVARQFSAQANGDNKLKAIWWLGAVMGQHNAYEGEVIDYQALYGTGGAVVRLVPSVAAVGDLEYDEDTADVYKGDRNVLAKKE
jgi:2-aminophenol/2-amino-5-chlorophenol 1,6-dioxygenase alpha subunit